MHAGGGRGRWTDEYMILYVEREWQLDVDWLVGRTDERRDCYDRLHINSLAPSQKRPLHQQRT